jgi:hypothetical protein
MNQPNEDEIDALLRAAFDGPVPNDGFSESVMAQLPQRHQHRNWPALAGTMAGVAACGFSLWSAPIASAGWSDWLSGNLTGAAITLIAVMTGMAALALAWALAEVDDRTGTGFVPL